MKPLALKSDPVDPKDRKRLLCLALVLFVLFSLLAAQFFRIQIIEGEQWEKEGDKQHFFIVKEPFLRGTFFSNTSIKKGHPEKLQRFVIDVQKFHLHIDPKSIPEAYRKEIADQLIALLDIVDETQTLQLREQFERNSRNRKLVMWLDRKARELVMQWWTPYAHSHSIAPNALFFVTDYQRSYPFGKLLGQVLHTVQSNKDEETKQAIPTGGLELYFRTLLQGKQGKRRLMRSPRNALEIGQVISFPRNGADIYLTVNHHLQAIAEEEVAKAVKKTKAKAGWAVMMHPRTGEILALAQYPFFNPLEYTHFFNDPLLIENTKAKAITDANEPGSIMKPFTIAIALLANEELQKRGEKKLFDPEEKIATSNGRFPGRSKPITDTHLHHFCNMDIGLQRSSNIYMGRLTERIINRLGRDWYRYQLSEVFCFGKKTGIELPSESRGVLPTPEKKHPNGTFEWSTPTPFSLAIGHNIQVTSLQMVRAYAMLANGGYLVEPTLVRQIVRTNENGEREIILDNTIADRIARFPRLLSPEIAAQVVKAMKYTTKPGGTARRADIPGYTEAGKTSTAKKIVNGAYSETKYIATFVGFAPVENPEFVLLVAIDEPEYGYQAGIGKIHHGGTTAAPVFREIGKRTLEYLGVAPDDPFGYPVGDPRYRADKADWIKETERLQEIYEKWNKGLGENKLPALHAEKPSKSQKK